MIEQAVCETGRALQGSHFPSHAHVSTKLGGLICSCWVADRNGTAFSGSRQYSLGRRVSTSINIDECSEGRGMSKQNWYGQWYLMAYGIIRVFKIYRLDNITDAR